MQTASGYDVAWKVAGTDEYTVWNTDSNGNYISNLIGAVPGNSYALKLFEPVFNQDLNGDGVIGAPGTTALRASGFLSTVGVVTHIPYTDGGYVNLGNVVADLHYLGITQIRDSLSDGSYGGAPLSSDIYLAQQGIKFTTVVEESTTAGLNYPKPD